MHRFSSEHRRDRGVFRCLIAVHLAVCGVAFADKKTPPLLGSVPVVRLPGESHRGELPEATEDQVKLAKSLREHVTRLSETIGERLERDLAALRKPLPPPYDACEKVPTTVSSLSLVRYRGNDYSVPTEFGHAQVLVRGYVHEVVIACGTEVIARHPRSYEREDFVFDPLHYLALIEQKINALDQAAPLANWQLPEEFATLRRLLEARMGKPGKREFVQVLRLMETFRIGDVAAAVRDGIDRGAVGFDAIKHLLLCRIERRPPRLDLSTYPYLPRATVKTTSARDYMGLLAGHGPSREGACDAGVAS